MSADDDAAEEEERPKLMGGREDERFYSSPEAEYFQGLLSTLTLQSKSQGKEGWLHGRPMPMPTRITRHENSGEGTLPWKIEGGRRVRDDGSIAVWIGIVASVLVGW